MILSHDPAGASTKTLIHFGQEIESGKFRQFDYGREKNLLIYNATEPPDYNLTNIKVPIGLFYADNDWLADSLVSRGKMYLDGRDTWDIHTYKYYIY